MELTDLQKKTLNTFSLYCQSQNAEKVVYTASIEDCDINYYSDEFENEYNNNSISGYDKILKLIREISNEIENDAIDSMEECENYGEIKFLIDCIEKDLTIQVFENVQTSTEDGSSDEIPDDEHFKGLIEYMKKNNYSIGHVYFNGGGDNGYIENNIDFSGGGSGRAPLDRFGNVEDYLYDMLTNTLPGWEIDAGSSGTFEINLNDDMIYLGINVYENEMQLVDTLARIEF